MSQALVFVLAALAAWRLTHLLAYEDGPGAIIGRLRAALGAGFAAAVLGCFNCLSLWVAAPLAFVPAAAGTGERLLWWLGLSGAACLLERLAGSAPAAFHYESTEESHDGMLRTGPGHDAPGRR